MKLSKSTWLVKSLLYQYKNFLPVHYQNSFTGFYRYLPVQIAHLSRACSMEHQWRIQISKSFLFRLKSRWTKVNCTCIYCATFFYFYVMYIIIEAMHAPVEPPDRPVPGLLEAVRIVVRGFHHVVQLHHDVGSDRSLGGKSIRLFEKPFGLLLYFIP